MRAWRTGMAIAATMLGGVHAGAQPAMTQAPAVARPADGDIAVVDYAKDAAWICRPGVDDGTCSANLDAVAVDAGGRTTPAPFVAARDPKIDCFYVYPTVSRDPTLYADMAVGAEEKRAVHGQAARLRETCRLFAPAYHQLTNTGLGWALSFTMRGQAVPEMKMDVPYRDVLAAWRDYLARDNHGRGVVLVGHSQGAMLLKRLIAEEIDGRPAQKRLVAAYLAGNDDLTAATFRTVKPCMSRADTGCVVAWSSYRAGYVGRRIFGGGGAALCVDPADPQGAAARVPLKAYFSKPAAAPAGDPPYVESIGQLTATCRRDDKGAVLDVRIEPGPAAERLEDIFGITARLGPSWGLHPLDISLVQGNMIEMIAAQAAAWPGR